ncbi:winged helix-turn-helix domain-containing protein [Planctomyces sp. SH-PL62]|uniref:winged helix-turn-helix domain-containing protein n=1 Tax=Planctomyces sp. SH-PL62 TaxID=1636152 RepID=UPI0039658829
MRGPAVAIPDFQTIMLPVLKLLADGRNWSSHELTIAIADQFGLTEEEREHRVPSDEQTTIGNRVSWARSHMKFAGLVEYPMRGRVRITDLGRSVLAEGPARIDVKFLTRFPSYIAFKRTGQTPTPRRDHRIVARRQGRRGGTDAARVDRLRL